MRKISVDINYPILIESGLIAQTGKHVRRISDAMRACVITDSNVRELYAETVCNSLSEAGFETSIFTYPAGEKYKTLSTISNMLDFLSAQNLTRSDIVIALGGGVCGDLAGFASAIYLRGIDFVQIPTTLLAQIDSSVGGKTGCDLPGGKNMAGAFHQPRLVMVDPETLSTLPEYYMQDGMGEAIKYGCIQSAKLFERLENEPPFSFIPDMIYECVSIKKGVVERDPYEKGERMLLNFGHTLGHALEKYEKFEGISHGRAVGIGMLYITRAAENAGLCQLGCADRMESLLRKYSLPVGTDAPLDVLCKYALSDKKRSGSSLSLVMISDIGQSFVKKIPSDELYNLVEDVDK